MSTPLRRGIAPDLLVSQVKNTMPYLFTPGAGGAELESFPPTKFLRGFENQALSHFEYFRLCLSAHYASCGTPVPTDVDNQIRMRLWPKELPIETAIEMVELVLESHDWDFRSVTTRYVYGAKGTPWENQTLSGHLGEWFTVICGAYCAMKQYDSPLAKETREKILTAIESEVNRHSEIFASHWLSDNGLGALKACSSLAHNFGDLDRVMDMWELDVGDPLRLKFYKLGANPYDSDRKLRYRGRLWVAGELYKSTMSDGSSMALENHRHYALRKPRALRTRPEFLVPTAPFFDQWGENLANGLTLLDGTPSPELLEVTETLREAWPRQAKTFAYGRALRSIREAHPTLDCGNLGSVSISQEEFETRWSKEALAWMEEIPSRA